MTAPFRVFVTATDTGVGKTETACALLSLLSDKGFNPVGFKPYESGCDNLDAPSDALRHQQASKAPEPLSAVSLHRFKEPLAPGIAAARLGTEPDFEKTLAAFASFEGRSLVVEGAGGLLVPLDSKRMVVDLISTLKLPVVLVARAGLGTLNHVGLSLEALSRRGIAVKAVVLSKSTQAFDLSEEDNPSFITKTWGVKVLGPIPYIEVPEERLVSFKRVLSELLVKKTDF